MKTSPKSMLPQSSELNSNLLKTIQKDLKEEYEDLLFEDDSFLQFQ